MNAFEICVVFILSVSIGNCGGDMQTLKNCATKGQAHMLSGGTIKCEVMKEGAK